MVRELLRQGLKLLLELRKCRLLSSDIGAARLAHIKLLLEKLKHLASDGDTDLSRLDLLAKRRILNGGKRNFGGQRQIGGLKLEILQIPLVPTADSTCRLVSPNTSGVKETESCPMTENMATCSFPESAACAADCCCTDGPRLAPILWEEGTARSLRVRISDPYRSPRRIEVGIALDHPHCDGIERLAMKQLVPALRDLEIPDKGLPSLPAAIRTLKRLGGKRG